MEEETKLLDGSEELEPHLDWLSTGKDGEIFEVLQDTPNPKEIDPELFWDKEAIIEDLKKNHVDIKEVKAFWYDSKLVTIDLPAVWDFQWKKVNFIISRSSEEQSKNDKLQEHLLSLDDLHDILDWIVSYMKILWVEIDWKFTFEYSEDFKDFHEWWVLDTFLDLLQDEYLDRFMLKKSRMFVRHGDYLLFDSDNIEWYREESPLLKFSDPSIDENIVYPVEWSCYGRFSLHDWNGESQADEIMWKMEELKNADLVLVFRDNDKYMAMARELKELVKYKYGWKVYCISIPKGTEKEQLTEQDKKVLTEVLTTCKCMTDYTVSEWTWIETKKIEETLSDAELTDKQNEFLDTVRNIESYYMDKWIDTVYILSSYRSEEQWVWKLLLEHGWFCQKEDGTIYYVGTFHDQDEEHYIDAKRFWKNLFPHMHVEIIEEGQLARWKNILERSRIKSNYDFDYSKSEWALAILDRHFTDACEDFKAKGWCVVTFGWDEIWSGISAENIWKSLAKKICERK